MIFIQLVRYEMNNFNLEKEIENTKAELDDLKVKTLFFADLIIDRKSYFLLFFAVFYNVFDEYL